MDVAVFELGSTRHAVDLTVVAKVIPISPITPVPASPAALLGAMNVGGKVVPVLDLGRLLDQPSASPTEGDESLLLRASGYEVVGVVGRILDVRAMPEPTGDAEPGTPAERGWVKLDGEQVMLVDAGALIRGLAARVAQMASRAQVSVFSQSSKPSAERPES